MVCGLHISFSKIFVTLLRQQQLNFLFYGQSGEIFGSVGQENNDNNNIVSFRVSTSKNKNIDHGGKEIYAKFSLSIQNENSAINVSLPFLLDLFKLKEKDHI